MELKPSEAGLFSAPARFMKRAVKKEYEHFCDADYDQLIPVATAQAVPSDVMSTDSGQVHTSYPSDSHTIVLKPTNPFSNEYVLEETNRIADLSPVSQDDALLIDSAFSSAPFLRKKQKKKTSLANHVLDSTKNPASSSATNVDVFAAAPFSSSTRSTPASIKTSSSITTSPPCITPISPPCSTSISPPYISPTFPCIPSISPPYIPSISPPYITPTSPGITSISPPVITSTMNPASLSPQSQYHVSLHSPNPNHSAHRYVTVPSPHQHSALQLSPPLYGRTEVTYGEGPNNQPQLDLFGCGQFNNNLQCTDFFKLNAVGLSAPSASGSTSSTASIPISPTENIHSQDMVSTNPFLSQPFQSTPMKSSEPWLLDEKVPQPISWQHTKALDEDNSESEDNEDENGMAELLHDTTFVNAQHQVHEINKSQKNTRTAKIMKGGDNADTSFSNMSFLDDGERQNNNPVVGSDCEMHIYGRTQGIQDTQGTLSQYAQSASHTLPRSNSKKYRCLTNSPSAEPFTVKKRTPTLFK